VPAEHREQRLEQRRPHDRLVLVSLHVLQSALTAYMSANLCP
jgi:hypothetical protein